MQIVPLLTWYRATAAPKQSQSAPKCALALKPTIDETSFWGNFLGARGGLRKRCELKISPRKEKFIPFTLSVAQFYYRNY